MKLKYLIVILLIYLMPVKARALERESLSLDAISNYQYLPKILSEEDVSLYSEIFELQEDGNWKQADSLIKKVRNKILMGHVLAQRYLHPTKYRSRYKELQSWLSKYADNPDAKLIYNTAIKKGNHRHLRYPVIYKDPKPANYKKYEGWLEGGKYSIKANMIFKQFRRAMMKGWTKTAKRILEEKSTQKYLTKEDYDMLCGYLGFHYFLDKRYDWAYKWSYPAATRSKNPMSLWSGALSAWKLNKFNEAEKLFISLAKSKEVSPWLTSAGAYWAYRSSIKSGNIVESTKWLELGAKTPKTFYGMLCLETLGRKVDYRWIIAQEKNFEENNLDKILKYKEAKKAFALLQVNKPHRAERELYSIFSKGNDDDRYTLMLLAEKLKMPGLALKISKYLTVNENSMVDRTANYPVPDWQPEKGWEIDKALVYAFIRQESRFNALAKSKAGARGLMQIMPSTAAGVASNRRLKWNRISLLDPEYNLYLGQKYLKTLMRDNRIKNNIFFVATAYNGGPGNLFRWRRYMKYENDPLMFIESIPSRETRIYIERVVTNLWIYRSRLGQQMETLKSIAQGDWPLYEHKDEPIRQAKN